MRFWLQWLWTVLSCGMWHLFDGNNFTTGVEEQDGKWNAYLLQTPKGHINNSSYKTVETLYSQDSQVTWLVAEWLHITSPWPIWHFYNYSHLNSKSLNYTHCIPWWYLRSFYKRSAEKRHQLHIDWVMQFLILVHQRLVKDTASAICWLDQICQSSAEHAQKCVYHGTEVSDSLNHQHWMTQCETWNSTKQFANKQTI